MSSPWPRSVVGVRIPFASARIGDAWISLLLLIISAMVIATPASLRAAETTVLCRTLCKNAHNDSPIYFSPTQCFHLPVVTLSAKPESHAPHW
jgi:hypothetical protein